MTARDLLTVGELIEEFGDIFKESTLRSWRHEDRGPRSFRLGTRVVYKRADVEAWIERQYEDTAKGGTAA